MLKHRSQSQSRKSVDGLTRRSAGQDPAFFSEIDKIKNRFTGFWFVSIIILVAVFIGLITVAANLKRAKININDSVDDTGDNSGLSFSDRLSSITSLGSTMLVFNSQEFTTASGADGSDFPIKDSKFTFSKDQIVLSGKMRDSWIPLSIKIKISAAAVGGKFTFIIAPNELENIVVYGENKDKIEKTFNQNINKVLEDKNMIAKSISISDDRLELQVIKEPK